ncbi:ABC transporter ATP-binding protein [Sphingomonas sp. DG1-23]|uniref:ABC transporter ATP-binding protein n=1 Tax=Sphingomonas sp. DG1-23 TaxID=3068316 RepID=UPI00273FDB82|nr:ABC transporter ATP-binding protein [Sphingomonas sp. DG1-23]MDP5279882.1 ABC transporter ATP-binding protein [Sphingomonas sp. DG1-23]
MTRAAPTDAAGPGAGPASYAGLFSVLGHVRIDRAALAVAALLTLVEVGGTLGFPLLTRTIVDGSAALSTSGGLFGQPAVVQLVLVLLAAAVAAAVARYLTSRAGLSFGARLRSAAVERLVAAPVTYLDGLASGEVTSRVINDTKAVAQLISRESLNAASAILLLTGAALVLFSMDAALAGILFGVIGAAFLAMLPVMLTMAAVAYRTQDETARLSGRLTQVFAEMRMVKTFDAEERERRRADAGIFALFALGCRSARIEAGLSPVMTLAVTISLVTILAYGGMRVAAGSLSSGTLTAFLLYIFTVVGPLAQLTSFFSQLSVARGASTRLAEVLRLAPEWSAPATPRAPVGRMPKALAFDQVRFSYGDRLALSLDGLVFAPGSRTAIIGPSGSGKSTLLALVERFYTPDQGSIRHGDENITAIPLREWRARIGYVAQTSAMLSGNVRDNLLYGIDRPVGDEAIASALALSRSDGFVAALPEGLDTQIGERGARLSGGERQRLAIARMFLRDPEILLLDEATSSLDEENAHLVLQGLDALMRGRTCILVTHRMTGLESMDQIVALDRGELAECGAPEALLSGAGFYRRLVHRQFLQEKFA